MKQNKNINYKEDTRTSFFASFVSGSITIETAMILPIVIITLLGILYFIIIMNLQMEIQHVLNETGREAAKYAYLYEEMFDLPQENNEKLIKESEIGVKDIIYSGFTSVYALKQIKEKIGLERLNNSCIRGGSNGLILLGGDFLSADDVIDLVLRYYIDIPYFPNTSFGISIIQRCRVKAWTGYKLLENKEDLEEQEEIVFITEHGTVYHTNRNCSHLNLSTRLVNIYQLDTLRNFSGGKYYPCELCMKSEVEGIKKVYITNEGDRFHINKNCSGLKRTIKEIPISEVEGKGLCKRCGVQLE